MKYERAKRKGEEQPKFSVDEAKAFRSFANFKVLRSIAADAGKEIEPDELAKVELPELFPIDPDDERDVANKELPFEQWSDNDKQRAYAHQLIGRTAQVHSLKNASNFNGMIVKIDAYNEEEEMFETTLQKSKAMLKVGFEKLKVIEHGMDVKDPRDNMMLLTGEEVRIEHGQCFKKTRPGADGKEGIWRRCKADGEFFRVTATQKPVEIIQSMWHNARKSKELQRQIALLEMEKITKANPGLMASAKAPL